MTRAQRLLTGLLLTAMVTVTNVQQSSPEFIQPTRPVPTGLAPHMQVKLVSQQEGERTFAVIFGSRPL